MTNEDYKALASELSYILSLQVPPLAITFSEVAAENVPAFEGIMPEPADDGRTGRVPAGCVFWIKAQDRTFSTAAEDHGNCSVGSVTHGLKTLNEVSENSDVASLVGAGWVTPGMIPQIPTVKGDPSHVTYGPLYETPVEPDVVFLRLNAKQAMVMADALPDINFQGKPQCHIIAIAKEQNEVAISVGCMLSRVRTGMTASEMTCAIPAGRLTEVVEKLRSACNADKAVAAYASDDSKRFGQYLS
ncbi:MAG: DUF169 domain-containing protein [Gammaproteobacteria bacterium]|nr:DUF169 domain-containing protein [Gammaproteobacteria bacterium]